MNFKVTIENFEGPIDALLQLIEKRKLPISDISLVEITDDYISFIQNLDTGSLSDMTHFIFVASTLTLIKSKSLLPNIELSDEEEDDIENLKKRIELFNLYREASLSLKKYFSPKSLFYYPKPQKSQAQFTPHKGITILNLHKSLQSVFADIPEKENAKKEASIRIAVHIEEMMDSLEERITREMKTHFSSYMDSHTGDLRDKKQVKVYKVIGFLAMLELVKNGALQVLQEKNFEEIVMESVTAAQAI